MTNRRLAVTSRSAAFSSPRCTRRARRRSSAGSLMSGSFWMSCRYWSKAPEGLARKNAFALPPLDRAIARAPTLDDNSSVGESRTGAQYRNRPSMVQIYTFFHITNCDVAAWVRGLSTIHIACGEIDVDPRLIRSVADVETCTPVWEVVDGYVIMSGSDGRPSTSPNPAPIVPVPCRLGGPHEQPHHRRDLHRGRALGPARARGHE